MVPGTSLLSGAGLCWWPWAFQEGHREKARRSAPVVASSCVSCCWDVGVMARAGAATSDPEAALGVESVHSATRQGLWGVWEFFNVKEKI